MKPYYDHAGITIYHGDCREILPQLPKVDLVLTDPPYGLGDKWSGGTWGANPMYKDAKRWDKKIKSELINTVIEKGIESILWGYNYYTLPPCRGFLAWVKVPSMETMADLEIAWTNFDRPAKAFTESRNPDGERKHPTQKPLKLMSWCIQKAKSPLTILDPFMGSGTTLRAAKDLAASCQDTIVPLAANNLGRKAIGIEIEEKYCEIAAERLAQEVLNF